METPELALTISAGEPKLEPLGIGHIAARTELLLMCRWTRRDDAYDDLTDDLEVTVAIQGQAFKTVNLGHFELFGSPSTKAVPLCGGEISVVPSVQAYITDAAGVDGDGRNGSMR